MATRRERILRLLEHTSGLTDREITDQLEGHSAHQQPINQLCRRMAAQKIIIRQKRYDGLIGNYLASKMNHQKDYSIAIEHQPKQPSRSTGTKENQNIETESLKKLVSLGFERAGRWFWEGKDLNFELNQHSKEKDILYAFIVDGKVKYIGKTLQTLHKRIYFYKNCGPSQRTNIRVREKIRTCLKQGSQVLIYALVQKMPLMYQDIAINIAAGIEDNLIAHVNPEWNLR